MANAWHVFTGNVEVPAELQRDNLLRLRAMERRHVRDHPDGERLGLTEILAAKGLSGAALDESVTAICRSDRLWVDLMLIE